MNIAIKRIVIVGGGAAGWMSAIGLANSLPGCTIELIESEEIGIVGVGEATFPSIRKFHQLAGIDETQFMRATNATYKLGIEFRDWRAQGERYFHTFGEIGELSGPEALWGHFRRLDEPSLGVLGDHCLSAVMAREGRFFVPQGEQEDLFQYAYHFDAALYAGFLRKIALERGVRRTEGRIVDVARRADGAVDRLTLADGRVVAGDLFIDCSGFASLLLGQTLGEPFVDFSHWLPVDRAWACPSEPADAELTPYTRATALEAGWAWRIPLTNRVGNGHVFASRYVDEARAREQLLAQLDGPALAEPRLLKFTTGHRERFWVGNVVALGLSAGFLEPLESTSIFLIQSALGRLIKLLQAGDVTVDAARATFNKGMVSVFARVRDFIILHYCLSARRDSEMWRSMASMALPDTLAYKLEAWRHAGVIHQYPDEGFDGTSWLAIHAGMRHWPVRTDPILGEMPRELALQLLRQRRDSIAAAVAGMPRHAAYLRSVLAR